MSTGDITIKSEDFLDDGVDDEYDNTMDDSYFNANNNIEEIEDSCDDAKLQNLLREFDLEILYTILKLGDITYRSLEYISENDINCAVRSIAYRAEFREKLFAWRKEKFGSKDIPILPPENAVAFSQQVAIPKEASATTNSDTIVIPEVIGNSNKEISSVPLRTKTLAMVHEPPAKIRKIYIYKPAKVTPQSAAPALATISMAESVPAISEPFSILQPEGGSPNMPCSPASNQSTNFEDPLSVEPSTSHAAAMEMTISETSARPSTPPMVFHKFNLNEVLVSSHFGRKIKQFYQKFGYLGTQHRNELVKLIVDDVIQRNIYLTPSDFRLLMRDVVTIFPKESDTMDYYIVYREGKNPLGRLYGRYLNANSRRRKLNCVIDPERNDLQKYSMGREQESDKVQNLPKQLPEHVLQVNDIAAIVLKQRMNNSNFSWCKVCEKWLQTWTLRQKEIRQLGLTEYLKNWPKLKDSRAMQLIDIDFKTMYPAKENQLYFKWEEFIRKIIPFYEKNLHNEEVKRLYKYTKQSTAQKDVRDYILTVGLNAILPTTVRFKNVEGKCILRATISDSLDAFALRINSVDDFDVHLNEYMKRFGTLNRTMPPLLVIVGEELNFREIYVVLEKQFYRMNTFLQALDFCYKLFHTLNLKYPAMCENVWTLLQRYIYGMVVPWEARNSNLSGLISTLNVM